jgi:hypothetical protein
LQVDTPYLVRELRDCLRGVDKLPKSDRGKYFSYYLNEVFERCIMMQYLERDYTSPRFDSDVVTDCILAADGLNTVLLERFLKVYI